MGTVADCWPGMLNSHITDGHVGTVTACWPGVLNSHLTGGHVDSNGLLARCVELSPYRWVRLSPHAGQSMVPEIL